MPLLPGEQCLPWQHTFLTSPPLPLRCLPGTAGRGSHPGVVAHRVHEVPGPHIYHTTFLRFTSSSDASLKTGGLLTVETGVSLVSVLWCPWQSWPAMGILGKHVAPTHLVNGHLSALLPVAAVFPVIYPAGALNESPHRGFPGWKCLLPFNPFLSLPWVSQYF